jgi:drug/metabolite transporter (DMT)-like permease
MSDRLSLSQVAALMGYAAAMGYFFVALILYAALTVLWVWILSYTPLSRAYPFLALAFALTPALGCLVFAEPLRYGS